MIYTDGNSGSDATAPNAPGTVTVSGATANSLNVSWGSSSGDSGANQSGVAGYIVVRGTSDPTTAPNANATYTTTYNAGAILAGTVGYSGSGASFTDSGLSASTTYYYRIYTYDKALNYSSAATGNGKTLSAEPTSQSSSVGFSSVADTSMTVSWTIGNGASRIVLVKQGSAVDANPTDGSSYTASATFGSGTHIGTGNYVAYSGSGNSFSLSGLTPSTTYHVAVYEFNGSGGTENYLTTSPATGSQQTTSGGCTTPTAQTVSGTTTICSGGSATVTMTSSESGVTYQLYAGASPSGSTVTGDGSQKTWSVSPTVSTTYTVQTTTDGGYCAVPMSGNAVITVNTKSSDPSSASASATTICSGQSTTLTLNGGGGGTGETIKWYAGGCGSGGAVATGNNQSVSPTTTTTYYGRYEDGAPCSYNSGCASVTVTVTETPAAPTIGTTTPGCGSVQVSWTAPSSGPTPTGYNVQRGTASGGPYTTLAAGANVSGSPFTDSTASTAGFTYYYVVTALNGSCEGAASGEVSGQSATPKAPTIGAATPGNASVQVNWTAPSSGPTPTGYNVKRSMTQGSGYTTLAAGANVSGSPFTDSTAVNETTYYYVVTALNGGCEGAASSEVSAVPSAYVTIADLELGTTSYLGVTDGSATFTYKDANIASLPALTLTSGQQGQAGGTGYVSSKAWNVTSQDTARYWQFTLTASAGYQIAVNSIVIRGQRSGSGPTDAALRSDADSYGANIGTQSGLQNNSTVISFAGLTLANKSSITFRVYGWETSGGASGGTWRIGDGAASSLDINVRGLVTCISPTAYNVTGGGSFCSGGSGVSIGVDGSQTGKHYQVWRDNSGSPVTVESSVAGTGSAITTLATATVADTYTVVATDDGTSCTANMTGSAVVTVDALPIANSVSSNCTPGLSLVIRVPDIASDPENATLTASIGTGPTKGQVSVFSVGVDAYFYYTNSDATATSDSFTYTVNDGQCNSASATVSIAIAAPNAQSQNKLANPEDIGDGTVRLKFLGIPDYKYALEWTHDLTPTITWVPLVTNQASTNGLVVYTNTPSGNPSTDYYRTRWVP